MSKILFSVLLCAAFVSMAQAEESEVTRAMKKYNIIPDVISTGVSDILDVTFEDDVTVDLGNEITVTETRNQPEVKYDAEKDSYYLIMVVDPDAPKPSDPFNKNLNTWMVGNIPGNDIDSGDVIYEYIGSATPKGSGEDRFNRYVYLLYKQPSGIIDYDEELISKNTFEGRSNFSPEKFASKYGLGTPVAANFYKTQFDPYTLVIYRQVNCCFEFNSA